MTSLAPPAADGTTKVIGRVGQYCATLGAGKNRLQLLRSSTLVCSWLAPVSDRYRPWVMMEGYGTPTRRGNAIVR